MFPCSSVLIWQKVGWASQTGTLGKWSLGNTDSLNKEKDNNSLTSGKQKKFSRKGFILSFGDLSEKEHFIFKSKGKSVVHDTCLWLEKQEMSVVRPK